VTLINKTFSHYQILSQIGEGGMGSVYLADDLKHGRRVAIKVMKRDLGAAIGNARFIREIEIAARLTHPHILPLHDSGLIDGQPYYVMPYIEGESLRQRIVRQKSLAVIDALRIATEIAGALGYAHEQGLIHRDIKPENVLLADGIALVADFGLARYRISDEQPSITVTNTIIGTPAYMSPEQLEGVAAIDGRADLYSLGCVLYEMLVGSPPFTGSVHVVAYQHISASPSSVSDIRTEVPAYVDYATMTLLAKRPEHRFTTAADFIRTISTPDGDAATLYMETSRSITVYPTNLPKDRTRFIGRNQELDDCDRMLESTRLLTLAGLGGCGKTRLAIKLAERVANRFPYGVWFVDLAPLTEGSRVVDAVAQVLKLREDTDRSLHDLMISQISDTRVLLVLDNCEHLASSCAEFVDRVLSACPEVRILATSRDALNVQGEQVMPLAPLNVPDFSAGPDLGEVQSADSVKLFVDRAQTVRSGFELTSENFVSVADVCRRLDGIPLAIELAAARVKILSVEQILTKLDDRFRLLSDAGRSMLPRHKTLRAVIEWSYDHLTDEEQRLIRALSIFAGGWNLGLAARVAGGIDEFELLDLHSQLVDKSILVVSSGQLRNQRYSFLETVRQFLFERLIESGEVQMIREAHLETMLNLAELAYVERITKEEEWAKVLAVESDNLRVALEFARTVDSERYLRLVGSIAWFWLVKAHLFEARKHLTAALASSAAEPSRPARARALWGAAQTLAFQGNASAARSWMDEALRTWRDLGDTHEIALALEGIGWTHFFSSEDEEACTAFEECLRLQRASGDQHLIIRAMVGLAQVLVALGRTTEAKPMAEEIIEFSKAHDDKRSEHFGWHYLADCELILGNCRTSLDLYKLSLVLAQAIGDKVEISFEVQGVAMSLAGLGKKELAVQLAGAVRAEWDRLAIDVHVRFWDALLDRYIGAAKQNLGTTDSEAAWAKGRSIPFEEAVALALEIQPD
jgi:predicted ATPase